MRDFVSSRWPGLIGLLACLAFVSSISVSYGFSWLTLLWVSLAPSTSAVLIGRTSTPSVAQVINRVEAEPFNGRKKL